MALPGSPAYPDAKTDLEAYNQIVKLLFTLCNELGALRTDMATISNKLQLICNRIK
jgi:hypothetical protein